MDTKSAMAEIRKIDSEIKSLQADKRGIVMELLDSLDSSTLEAIKLGAVKINFQVDSRLLRAYIEDRTSKYEDF